MVENSWGVKIYFNIAVKFMDDDIREDLHMHFASCSEQVFFDSYCDAHREKYGEDFFLDTPNPVY